VTPEEALDGAAREIVEKLRDLIREIVRQEGGSSIPERPQREWFTIHEAAEHLRISRRVLERLLASGEVRSTNVGDRRRIIRREWLDNYAASREDSTSSTARRRRARSANHTLGGQHAG
jgi:excisionase family DNA binding protein